ncbi:hypothetical protein [Siphonobacter aquaeclarae]|uniref:Uncharacterized protein n=1 Tax=Siphonobacter aquaeclarae TaxID=563176 RepID=A0A1G9TF31_9BACT|nr:hypothetical protein [Siphonobacter aquaeclarae]SDM46104.1 hypothetical protein SAMN04488090_3530 [Siphonobacter aquaeclarae]
MELLNKFLSIAADNLDFLLKAAGSIGILKIVLDTLNDVSKTRRNEAGSWLDTITKNINETTLNKEIEILINSIIIKGDKWEQDAASEVIEKWEQEEIIDLTPLLLPLRNRYNLKFGPREKELHKLSAKKQYMKMPASDDTTSPASAPPADATARLT